ncbi:MAG: phosphoribosylglycinamide formyltransferase [Planctomycetota bacterium]|nr:MAG: phosphoribosylglycinamide formyltransferase [Planctomycetota bacterium]
MKKRFATFISGRGSNLHALLKAYREGNLLADPVLILTNKKNAPGLRYGKEYQVPTFYIPWKDSIFAERKSVEKCREFQVDFIVLAGFMKILKGPLLEAFENRIINIHPSLLPAFPGKEAQKQAIEYGVRYSGCTTHFVNKEVDGGPIILQKVVEVDPNDSPEDLAARILPWEHKILVETVNLFGTDSLTIVNNRKVIIQNARMGFNQRNREGRD